MQFFLSTGIAIMLMVIGMSGLSQAEGPAAPAGEVLLTITGDITDTNAGDSLQLDLAQLAALPQTSFTTTTTWTEGPQSFQGVLLKDLISTADATGTTITLTAANDYAVTMPVADVGTDGPLLAYLLNGEPMALRDKGPLWVVYPYDSNPNYRTDETYSRSVWQLTAINFGD